jgi:hypothetical protein
MRASTVTVAGATGRRSRGRGGIRLSMYSVRALKRTGFSTPTPMPASLDHPPSRPQSPPDVELSLDEFETFAIDRLIGARRARTKIASSIKACEIKSWVGWGGGAVSLPSCDYFTHCFCVCAFFFCKCSAALKLSKLVLWASVTRTKLCGATWPSTWSGGLTFTRRTRARTRCGVGLSSQKRRKR